MTVLASTLRPFSRPRQLLAVLSAAVFASSCGGAGGTIIVPPVQLANITIDQGDFPLERGLTKNLTTTQITTAGVSVKIDVVWHSSDEKKATVDVTGKVTALDTGFVQINATSLGVTSNTITIGIVQLVAKIDQFQYTPLAANSPGSLPDSLRVVVTGVQGQPAPGRKVVFKVTGGGGSVSPLFALTNANGVAATQWTTGPAAGLNTVTATLVNNVDDSPITYITPNPITFSVRTFDAILPVAGNNQKGVILSALPVEPSVKVVDSTGKARPGIPVQFAATSGGRVQTQVVSTGADGVASPGIWTLGDIPGEQALVAKVDNATALLKATGTGTPTYFMPVAITAGQFVTCAINPDATASCFGEQPKVGDSTTVNRSTPTPTYGGIKFSSITAGVNAPSPPAQNAHICGVATDKSIYCWGQFALADTTFAQPNPSPIIPTKYPSDVQWVAVSPAQAHNCALAVDQSIQCWGDNSVGQLGDRLAAKVRYVAAPVFGGFKFTAVTSGAGHTCGLATDGSAYCWGYNAFGQLGNGTTAQASSPTAVSSGLTFKQVSAGDSFTCGILTLGQAYCWGNLGGSSTQVTLPRSYAGSPNFSSISSGGSHVCGLTSDGTAYCWGDNSVAQLGDSTTTYRASPTLVATTVKFKSISAGYQHTCGQSLTNAVLCWGLNRSGEGGDSVTTPVTARKQPRYIVLGVTPPAAGLKTPLLLKSKR